MKFIPDAFSGRKTRKDTTWSVPIVFPGCPVLHNCNPVFSILCEKADSLLLHRKQEFLERQESFAQLAATMMYYDVVKEWLQVDDLNTLLINIELIYIHALQVPDDMCYEMQEPIYIYHKKARLVYWREQFLNLNDTTWSYNNNNINVNKNNKRSNNINTSKHNNNIIKVNNFDIKIIGRIFSTGPDEADL